MKNYVTFALALLGVSAMQAQDITDALRYSQENLNGTARFRAMSGAFGALGGDFSAINVNPAGSAVFTTSQVGMTLGSLNKKNNSDYFGTSTDSKENSIDLSQGGAVFVFQNDNAESKWKKVTLGINYENTNNFRNSLFSAGTNPNNSIVDYFLSYANNGAVPLNTLESSYYENLNYGDAQAFLGYQAFLINPVTNDLNNSQYTSNVLAGGNYYQENSVATTGFNGKLNFNIATSYDNRFFFGLNLNSHFTDFRQSTSVYESNTNGGSNGVSKLRFNNELYTYGSGFSFQLGGIAKVTDGLRLGLAYDSPTWYSLNDEISQAVSSKHFVDNVETNTTVNPRITVAYDVYKLQTPGKWTGSAAYVIGTTSLISVDYSIKDYSATTFKPKNEFTGVNSAMSEVLDNSSEIRIGAEHRIKQLSLRAGYRMEQSPYKNKNLMGDLTGYSAGLGYDFGGTKLDVAYSYFKRDSQQAFLNQGFTDGANISSVNNNVSLSLIFGL